MLSRFPKVPMNSAIVASIIVVLTSLGLGLTTCLITFRLGSESLKGVTSPLKNPTQKIKNEQKSTDLASRKQFKIIEEKTVLVKVYDHVHKQRDAAKVKEKKANEKK